MIITKLSQEMDDFAVDVSKKLQDVYKDFEDDGSLKEDELASKAVEELNEICSMLEGTKFDKICDKILDLIEDITDIAKGSVEVTDRNELEEDVQKDIERLEESYEMPRARWEHD